MKERVKYLDLLIKLTERAINEAYTQGVFDFQLDKLRSERNYLKAKLKGKNAPKTKKA